MSTTVLPNNKASWDAMVKVEGLLGATIHQSQHCNSASSIGLQQFLLLYVVCLDRKYAGDLVKPSVRNRLIDSKCFEEARCFLDNQTPWISYLKSVKQDPSPLLQRPFPDLGTFSLVRYHQLASQGLTEDNSEDSTKLDFSPVFMRTRSRMKPSRPTTSSRSTRANEELGLLMGNLSLGNDASSITSDSPAHLALSELSSFSPFGGSSAGQLQAIQDEQIVNTSLILFLDAITIHCPEAKGAWSLHRHPFTMKDSQGQKIFEARVDGTLRRGEDNEVVAIVEVKPFARYTSLNVAAKIKMQEAAQMAAWISQYPPKAQSGIHRYVIKPSLVKPSPVERKLTISCNVAGYLFRRTGMRST